MEKMFHTPEGVRDIYNGECEKKQYLQTKIRDIFHNYEYKDIETPTFEYFEVFSREVGTTPSNELYKFFDRDGNTLVLRPDFTPSIARAAATYFLDDDEPIRLCYQGNTFTNNSEYQGRLKEATQMGVEYIGDASVRADAEMLIMTIAILKEAGLQEFQISVGQVQFFKALVSEAGMSEDTISDLRGLISNKNYFGVEGLIAKADLQPELAEVFLHLPQMFGGVEMLDKASGLTSNPEALEAVARLKSIYDILCENKVENYVSFDFGMLSKYNYYTGIIFNGVTYGSGEALVKGGRYDSLLQHFGKQAPAIGFGLGIDALLSALERQKIDVIMNRGGEQ